MGEGRGGLLLYVNMGKIGLDCYCMLTWGKVGWTVTFGWDCITMKIHNKA